MDYFWLTTTSQSNLQFFSSAFFIMIIEPAKQCVQVRLVTGEISERPEEVLLATLQCHDISLPATRIRRLLCFEGTMAPISPPQRFRKSRHMDDIIHYTSLCDSKNSRHRNKISCEKLRQTKPRHTSNCWSITWSSRAFSNVCWCWCRSRLLSLSLSLRHATRCNRQLRAFGCNRSLAACSPVVAMLSGNRLRWIFHESKFHNTTPCNGRVQLCTVPRLWRALMAVIGVPTGPRASALLAGC